MLLCVEGPDCAGKTTLLEGFREFWHSRREGVLSRLVHTGPPRDASVDPFTEYETRLDDEDLRESVLSPGELVLFDRWHAGEGVYGPLRRGKSRLTAAGILHVELSLVARGAVMVTCLPPLPELYRRFHGRGDQHTTVTELPLLHSYYVDHVRTHRHRWTVTGDESPRWLYSGLLHHAFEAQQRAVLLHAASRGTYVGSLTPEVLLVGDQRNARGRLDLVRPFTPVYPHDCSELTLNAVLALGIQDRVGLVNSLEDGVRLADVWRDLGHPRVVALGNLASGRLTRLGVPHGRAWHPQYAKRFHHHDFQRYVTMIEKATETRGNHL